MRGSEVLIVVLVAALLLYVLTRENTPAEPGPVGVRMGAYGAALDYRTETRGGGCCG